MSNFAFVRQALPDLYEDCAHAESYVTVDPRSACFYARRVAEELVSYLYDMLDLRLPYRNDLAAKIDDTAFKKATTPLLIRKLTTLRKVGNAAVHENRVIRPDVSLTVLRELLNVVIWAAYHHSPHPDAVPLQATFDPALAAKAAPLSRSEVVLLAEAFQKQDADHTRALVEKDELLAAHEQRIAELQANIAAAQANTDPDTRDYTERDTRPIIDLLLSEAGWPLDQPRDREYEVTGMPSTSGKGYVDYVLWGADGLPLGIVEAKRTSSSPEVGQQQAQLYADALERMTGQRPVILYSNGYEHFIWDDRGGYPPREIEGFYTPAELELLIQRRRTKTPLSSGVVNPDIAGRPYQQRAIKAVADVFDRKQREALLVMATGTGKTRTVIGLVDLLQRANWAKRVLFLADRTALVKQAAKAFTEHLPSSTTVNLTEEKVTDGRVYVSTYPTMLNLINELDDGDRRFGPGYFDLIIIDEAHRSVYAKYGAIFDYFDSLLVGLTATPKDEIDHNTYRLFHLEDGVPTDAYSLDEAVGEHYLVPPRAYSVDLGFARAGIKYADLTEDQKDEWDALEWGDDGPPTEVDPEGLNRYLFNADTVDKVIHTLMTEGQRVAGGDRIGKTVIFAKSQRHADFIAQRFDLSYPELGGQHARIITHGTSYVQNLIDDFSVKDKAPHIAISVDMLDTGIDVPEIVNLVLFKAVRSKSKFWQMIGRGTRLCPDLFGPGQDKSDFSVFDFCGTLEFFSLDQRGAEGRITRPLSQRIFDARLSLLRALSDDDAALRGDTADTLHRIVEGMNLDNVVVRKHRRIVEQFGNRDAWNSLTSEDALAAQALTGLPSGVRDTDEQAKRFDLMMLRRQLAQLEDDPVLAARLRESVQAIAVSLLSKTAIPSVAEQAELIEAVASDDWWTDVTLQMLETARRRMRGLVRLIERTSRNPVYTDFEDALGELTEIDLPHVTPGTDFERFRSKAEAYLRAHLDHLSLQRLRRNKPLTSDDLADLERLLVQAGGSSVDITRAGEQTGGLGLFVRSLVGLDRAAATEAFADFLDESRFSVEQIRFVGLMIDELTRNGAMEPSRLFEAPYTDHAPTGPDLLFPDPDVDRMVLIMREVTQNAAHAS